MAIRSMGLNIIGPFPKAVGNKKYLIVGTDYFTKWVKAEPLANIRDVDAKRFVWKALLLGLAFLMCSSQIMDSSLIARCSEIIMASWGLLTGILLRLTLKGMDKLKL